MKRIIFLILLSSILFPGCVRTFFPGYFYSSPAPLNIESRNNAGIKNTYSGFDVQNPIIEYDNESIYSIRGRYIKSYTGSAGSISSGLSAYAGLFDIRNEGNSVENYFGIGPELNGALMLPLGRFKMGIGMNIFANVELGSYYFFRREKNQGFPLNLYVSLFPVFSYEFENDYVLSFQTNLGTPGGISPMISINMGNDIFWLGWRPMRWDHEYINLERVGHLSIGYMFKI
ncbi:MAG: hypothetical protein ACM3O3_11040 [Syntrophothermus sp.]